MSRKKATGLTQAAKALGKKGGVKGGPARMAKLTKGERTELARKGGKAKAAKKGGR